MMTPVETPLPPLNPGLAAAALAKADAAQAACAELNAAIIALYPDLAGHIPGEGPTPAPTDVRKDTVAEDREIILQGIGAIEELKTWLYPDQNRD